MQPGPATDATSDSAWRKDFYCNDPYSCGMPSLTELIRGQDKSNRAPTSLDAGELYMNKRSTVCVKCFRR